MFHTFLFSPFYSHLSLSFSNTFIVFLLFEIKKKNTFGSLFPYFFLRLLCFYTYIYFKNFMKNEWLYNKLWNTSI